MGGRLGHMWPGFQLHGGGGGGEGQEGLLFDAGALATSGSLETCSHTPNVALAVLRNYSTMAHSFGGESTVILPWCHLSF